MEVYIVFGTCRYVCLCTLPIGSKVGLPYLRAKAADYFEALGGGLEHDIFDENARSRQDSLLSEEVRSRHVWTVLSLIHAAKTWGAKLRRVFKALYPWLNTSFEVWLLVCNVAYLFDKTPYYRPWLRWAGVDIRRMGADDMVSGIRCVLGAVG